MQISSFFLCFFFFLFLIFYWKEAKKTRKTTKIYLYSICDSIKIQYILFSKQFFFPSVLLTTSFIPFSVDTKKKIPQIEKTKKDTFKTIQNSHSFLHLIIFMTFSPFVGFWLFIMTRRSKWMERVDRNCFLLFNNC